MGSLARLIDGFEGLRVMVVGDLGLDHYLVGDAGRVSREYPVMILNHERDEFRLGGARTRSPTSSPWAPRLSRRVGSGTTQTATSS